MAEFSRTSEKNDRMVFKFHELSKRKQEIEKQIERSASPDQKTSLTLEYSSIAKKIKNFWDPRTSYGGN